MSCTKAQEFLAQHDIAIVEQVSASKAKLGRSEALDLARGAAKIICSRGKSSMTFDMRAAPPDEATLLEHLLGPTGNLRAPALRAGETLLVGFNAQAYAQALRLR